MGNLILKGDVVAVTWSLVYKLNLLYSLWIHQKFYLKLNLVYSNGVVIVYSQYNLV